MIRGYCKTSLDNYVLERWPESFVSVPRRGERVVAESGKSLAVVEVTHSQDKFGPLIIVELHR